MPLRVNTDPTALAWLRRADVHPDRLIAWGPGGFGAYARVRFIPDPTPTTRSEADVFLPESHPSDITQVHYALENLLSIHLNAG